MPDANDVKNKTIIYTAFYSRVKEAKAPWTLIENTLSDRKRIMNLMAEGNNLLCTSEKSQILVMNQDSIYFPDRDSIYFSKDEAKSWHTYAHEIPAEELEEFAMISDKNGIFVATTKGIYFSEKAGLPFKKINTIEFSPSMLKTSLVGDGKNIIVFNMEELHISNDGGGTWRQAKDIINTTTSTIYTGAVEDSFIIVGGFSRDEYSSLLLYSTDNGNTWNRSEEKFDDYVGIMPLSFLILGSSILMNTQYGWFISMDKGKSWNQSKTNILKDILSVAKNNSSIFIGGSRGVFLSVDKGLHWYEVNNKELKKGVTSIAILNSNIFALTSENKIWKAAINELIDYANKSVK